MASITQGDIEDWIVNKATGEFHYTKVLDGRINPSLYPQLRTIMARCRDKGLIYPAGKKDGWWRPADNTLEEIQWWESGDIKDDNLILPLGINNFCMIPKPSLVIISGTYNAGKTAFCTNTVVLNEPFWGGMLDFYVSEGADLLKPRFEKLGVTQAPAFRTYRRTENFADVINPDNLSVIDYLRVDMEQSYAVSKKLFEIFNKLNTGIAVVAMQKPKGERKLAFGGGSTAFEPTLYMGMESTSRNTGWIAFEKIKIVRNYGGFDPYNIKITYRLEHGVEFSDMHIQSIDK